MNFTRYPIIYRVRCVDFRFSPLYSRCSIHCRTREAQSPPSDVVCYTVSMVSSSSHAATTALHTLISFAILEFRLLSQIQLHIRENDEQLVSSFVIYTHIVFFYIHRIYTAVLRHAEAKSAIVSEKMGSKQCGQTFRTSVLRPNETSPGQLHRRWLLFTSRRTFRPIA